MKTRSRRWFLWASAGVALGASCKPRDLRPPAESPNGARVAVGRGEPPVAPRALDPRLRARPYQHRVPSRYDGTHALPLVVLLHGYCASGAAQSSYFGFDSLYESRGFLYAFPDGTPDVMTCRFWNATGACCDDYHAGIDDVGYLTALIDDMSSRYRVDPQRVFLVGHSNGGFMAHRMACDRAARVAAIVSLAGAVWLDPARCAPTEPVAVLDAHGTADEIIAFNGGMSTGSERYPSERDTLATWARRNRCGAFTEATPRFDFVLDVAGAETHAGRYEGCAGGAVELWTMDGASHVPSLAPSWAGAVYDWLVAHPKRAG